MNGIAVPQFDTRSMKISYSVPGAGTTGTATATMEFKTRSTTDISNEIWEYGAPVQLTCSNGGFDIPVFFVKTKNRDGDFTTWVCADKMSGSDALIEFLESDFNDGKISAEQVLYKASHAAGFAGITYVSAAVANYISIIGNISRTLVEDKTAREIFEMFASAFCGYWIDGGSGNIVFVSYGSAHHVISGLRHTPLKIGGKKRYTKLIMYNGDAIYTAGSGSADKTLMISTPLASQELCSAVAEQISDHEYQSWSCEKGLAQSYIHIGGISFGADTRICTNVTMYPTRSGMFFSASANAVSETDYAYQSQVQRQLKRKIELDMRNGNTAYGKNGISVFQNLNSGSPDTRKKATVITAYKSEV